MRAYYTPDTGCEIDIGVRDVDAESALTTLMQRLSETVSYDVHVEAMRAADEHDFTGKPGIVRLSEPRHFGLGRGDPATALTGFLQQIGS